MLGNYVSMNLNAGIKALAAARIGVIGGHARADLQFNLMPLSVDRPGDPLHNHAGFSASACQCRHLHDR